MSEYLSRKYPIRAFTDMRSAFNTTVDLWWGEGTAYKRTLKAWCDCRLVAEAYELPLQIPFIDRVAYVTMEDQHPVASNPSGTPAAYTYNFTTNDVLAIPAGSAPAYYVLFTELVSYPPQPDYYRAHIAPFTPTQATGDGTCGAITKFLYHNLVANKGAGALNTYSWNWYNRMTGREYSVEILSCTDAGVVARAYHGTCAALVQDVVQVGVGQTAWFTPGAGAPNYLRVGREAGAGAWTARVILHSRPL